MVTQLFRWDAKGLLGCILGTVLAGLAVSAIFAETGRFEKGAPILEDDDFGDSAMVDDDFGESPAKEASLSSPGEAEVDEEEPREPRVYESAAEAHLTFLESLDSEERYPSAAACGTCHPDHYREWSVSPHAYAQVSPVFNTMHAAILKKTSGTNGDFCIRCHTQVGMQRDEPLFTSNLNRHPASIEGISCIVCHRISKNYGKVSGRMHVDQGSIFEPVQGPTGNAGLEEMLSRVEMADKLATSPGGEEDGETVGRREIHSEARQFDPITTSGFCGTCHDVNLYNGFRLEEAFTQFKNSPANAQGLSCQDCHMGKVPGAVTTGVVKAEDPDFFEMKNYLRGAAARIGGEVWAEKGEDGATGRYGVESRPRKRTNHMFVGPDYSIVHPALFPHSEELRQSMWEYEREIPGTGTYERVGMKHLIEFRWEEGWGDPESVFEKRVAEDGAIEEGLPWPWDDSVARSTLREKLNDSFRLLNQIDGQRHQILRRALQFGDFVVHRNDAKGLKFSLEIVNATSGHAVPTGFDAERLMFLETTVRDREGRVVFRSGDRDPNGDVRDLHSTFVHHRAEKKGSWLAESDWREGLGQSRQEDEQNWTLDRQLFSLQSKFLVRQLRGGEREQVLAVNQSIDPLPYIRPDTRPGILQGRPFSARKQSKSIPPLGSRWADYHVPADRLTGAAPYTVEFRFICQMVPVNLIKTISEFGFDYNLSPREVAKRVAFGHRVSSSERDEDRRGGSLVIWEKTLVMEEAPFQVDLGPTEAQIMATPAESPFPYKDPAIFGAIDGILETEEELDVDLPGGGAEGEKAKPEAELLPVLPPSTEDDSFE